MTSCPSCGEPAERGQLVCLECGTRMALKEEGGERRSLDHLPAVALLLSVVVLGAGAIGFALGALTDDSERRLVHGRRRRRAPTPPASPAGPQTETETGGVRSSRAGACCWSGPRA